MARKLENAASLTIRVLQEITDNFSERRKIGQGVHGTVYKGVYANGEEIAVKLLPNNMQGTDDGQFKREFENLMRLEHQNVVRLVGYCYETQHKPMLYEGETIFAEEISRALCFEYMPNGSLTKHISEECDGLDWHARYKIIKGTCEGLKYLHEGFKEPIYHMDLKPDNILLDENMMPKLADFGLSKLFDGEQTMITQSLMGTIGYLPPEYLFEHVVSKKLDIFSLGVVMTKITTGPRGPSRRAEMTHQEFLDQVHENWRKRLQETWRASRPLEAYCEQVNICIEIALSCMETDRHKRPNIVDIIHKLNETETMIEDLKNDQGHQRRSNQIMNDIAAEVSQGTDQNPSTNNLVMSDVLENIEETAEEDGYEDEYDPLPSIDQLMIKGEAFPGRELQACGYSSNGTTYCNFEWVRHLEDGSVKFIEGSRQPTYLVTADDVDTLLAIEIQPLDDRNRKGDIVKVYANERRKITCDPEMKALIMEILSIGYVSYEVQLEVNYLMWEPAVLEIKRDGYSIKYHGRRVVITEKFRQYTHIDIIPYWHPTEFSIGSFQSGHQYKLKPAENSPSRDTIVLILRLFKANATRISRKGVSKFKINQIMKNVVAQGTDQSPSTNNLVMSDVSENLEEIGTKILQEPRAEEYDSLPSIHGLMITESKEQSSGTRANVEPGERPAMAKAAEAFTFLELATATQNFCSDCLLGEGGFGKVYKGQLENGQVVAVKKLDLDGVQGHGEFLLEILILDILHHPNLVSLVGYCAEGEERLLVYEYMPLGSLADHLLDHASDKMPLSWHKRMKIAYGTAKALEYLHEKGNPPVIHRDLKSHNILLDEEYNPKLSDFGRAKLGPVGEKTYVSTQVIGRYGCCAPEYIKTGQLSIKTDVLSYSFGVFLLELITGRRAVDSSRPGSDQILIDWAEPMIRDRRRYPELVDPLLSGEYIPEEDLCRAVSVAAMCLQEEASVRPYMGRAVVALGFLAEVPAGCEEKTSTGPRNKLVEDHH